MATYTSQWFSVDNGDTTTHNPQSLVAETSPIQVLSSQIQWEGVTTSSSSTSTNYSTNTNTTSATAYTTTSTSTSSNQNSDSETAYRDYTTVTSQKKETLDESTISINYPNKLTGETFESHRLTVNASTSSGEVVAYYDDVNGTNQNKTVTSSDSLSYSASTTSNYEGDQRSATLGTIQSGETAGIDIQGETTSSEVISRTAEVQAPSTPSGYSFDRIEVRYYSNGSLSSSDTYYDSAKVGNYFNITSNNTSNTVKVEAETFGTDSTTTVNSDTSCTSYPSVPNGYSFDRHYWREEKNNSYVDSSYIYTNKVGDSRCVTSNDPSNTWDLTMRTRGSDTTTTTTYYDTENPSVSGDVSGSYTGVLNDGETSPWQTLSGLTTLVPYGDNDFTHSISQSNKANFRFEFEWERIAPDPVHGTVAFYDKSTNEMRECSVADPTNTKLDYNHIAVYNESQGLWGALDVVDVSDPNAIESHQFYDSTVGWLAPRAYNAQSL